MSRRELKNDVLAILNKSDLEEIYEDLASYQNQRLLNPLFSALCHPEELVRWRAICCFGRVVPAIEDNNPENARIVMRRFLWSLNDESGGIGWGCPEAMAEIMCQSSLLRKEYLHMLVSYMREDGEEDFQDGNYLELPMLQRGLLWGIGRLCQTNPFEMTQQQIVPDLTEYLDSSDQDVSGLAIWCLGLLGSHGADQRIRSFLNSRFELRLFLAGKIEKIPVAQLGRKALGLASPDECSVAAGHY